jgi:plastocyanin
MHRITIAAAVLVAGFAQAATLEVRVRDASGAPVADAAVFAVPAGGGGEAKRAAKVQIEQREREFIPFVTVLQAGTTVSFPNRDPILHHVYSFSPAKSFEIKLYGQGKSPAEVVFDQPGVVTLGCNIHDWMIAYVVVVPTPYFGRSGADGIVRIRDLHAGSYEVRAWHPQQRSAASPQTAPLEAATQGHLDFTLDTAPRKQRYKPPLDRGRY